MEIGKVPENVLKRAVFKQIKHLRPEVLLHPGVGEDCSAIETAEDEVLVFSTDPITGASKGMGTLAVHITANDLASSGAEPVGILTCVILPPRTREKKLHDLELTRTISIQTAPQIRLVQGNNTMMVEKIQSTIVNTVPLWKSQMVLALGVAHSSDAVKAHREVTDMTNELLKKNADTLKMATVETAKETERGIVDIETLQHTNQTLISTLDEVMEIQQEGRRRRSEAETELRKMENELKSKLLEVVDK